MSIRKYLLKQSLDTAESNIKVSNKDITIIKQAKKSVCFHDPNIWMKKESRLFYVNTTVYAESESFWFVRTIILYQF